MFSSFPLLSLPHIPLDLILRSMDLKELIQMASISPVLKKYLPLLRISSGGYSVHLGTFNSRIELPTHSWARPTRHSIGPSDSMEQALDYWFDLERLFTGKVQYMNICPSLVWYDIYGSTDILAIGRPKEEYKNWESELFDEVPEAGLNYLLDNVEIRRGLALDGPIELRTQHEKVFNLDWLKISHSEWITLDILQKMRNKVILLEDIALSPENINDFIRDLKNGKSNQDLQVITMICGWTDEEKWTILGGLDFIRNQDEQLYRFNGETTYISEFLETGSSQGIEIYDCMDFWRVVGVRCSLVFGHYSLTVYVWNQRSQKRAIDDDGPDAKRNRV